MPELQPSNWLEIDLAAVGRNVAAAQKLVGPDTRILGVVKSNAYGHGAARVAAAAQAAGIHGFCVANLAEAKELRQNGIERPILLFNSGDPAEAPEIVRLCLLQTVYDAAMPAALSAAARAQGREAEIHIKVDSGMSRLGLCPADLLRLAGEIRRLPALRVSAACSHLATAEDPDPAFALGQFDSFQQCFSRLKEIFPALQAHIANSAAALKFPQMRLDFVRAGLLVYGVFPTLAEDPSIGLTPALSWKARVLFSKEIPAHTSVSYGCTWRSSAPTRLCVLPVGYADGFPRTLSNRSAVLLRGRPRPVVGTVCMNHILVDAGATEKILPGEEAVLIGSQGEARLSAAQLADWGDTVPHEILARLPAHLPRVYLS